MLFCIVMLSVIMLNVIVLSLDMLKFIPFAKLIRTSTSRFGKIF